MDNVNLLKSQGGITSVHIHQDPTNSAALLAQSAIQMIQMGRQGIPPTGGICLPSDNVQQSISTPFGYLPLYSTPNPDIFQYEPNSGYYYDTTTGFYYDAQTEYYFNSKMNAWMFWCSRYSTYIPVEGGDLELKKQLLQEEKEDTKTRNSAVISAPPTRAADIKKTEPQELPQELNEIIVEEKKAEPKPKKKKKRDDSEPKTALDIQKEMTKWARRQEKVKITFKQPETMTSISKNSFVNNSKNTTAHLPEHNSEVLQNTTWTQDDDEEETNLQPSSAGLSHRMKSVGLPLNYNNGVAGHSSEPDDQCPTNAAFDVSVFIDRSKLSCMLCRRQFANLETLNKHVQLSDLHKKNVAEKIKEHQSQEDNSTLHYRDRAKERRQIHGYDPSGLTPLPEEEKPLDTESLATFKATTPLDNTNIGNRMLKSMGWSEGSGLGRNQQGIVNPVAAEHHVLGVGLGASGSKLMPNISRKERLKQAAQQRFKDVAEQKP